MEQAAPVHVKVRDIDQKLKIIENKIEQKDEQMLQAYAQGEPHKKLLACRASSVLKKAS